MPALERHAIAGGPAAAILGRMVSLLLRCARFVLPGLAHYGFFLTGCHPHYWIARQEAADAGALPPGHPERLEPGRPLTAAERAVRDSLGPGY